MTTTNVNAALSSLEAIGKQYVGLHSAVPIDELSVFVGEDHIEVSMHWYFPGSTTTIELADKLITIDQNLPGGSNLTKSAEIVEEDGADQNRIDVTATYEYQTGNTQQQQ